VVAFVHVGGGNLLGSTAPSVIGVDKAYDSLKIQGLRLQRGSYTSKSFRARPVRASGKLTDPAALPLKGFRWTPRMRMMLNAVVSATPL
jgi:hypothetical protein